jgi:LPXTG-site transpeptidase (sortase) family protein
VTPSTVPPLLGATSEAENGAAGSSADPETPPDTESEDGLSPLAQQLGPRQSAVPEVVAPRPRPVGLQMQSIDVARFPVRPVGLELDGQMEIPDETEIGWYQYGATPGQPGATVLAAHVSWNRTQGPFARLGRVEPGEQLEVALDDGSVRRYEVTERTVYGKLELPRERIWRNSGDETLVLITCGGDFNPAIRRFNENIVVYAVPVG